VPRATSIARRYADAYFALAREAGDIEGWGRQLKGVTETLSRDDVLNALVNPRLSTAERTKIALDLLEGVSEPARNLARLLVERRRIALLPEILEHYQRLADRAAGVVRAEVTTAVEIDDRARKAIARALEERFGSKVNTELRTDPSILGGMVVRIGDRVIDDSVRTHLQQLQASLA
jgi:F-type H+-transporting ATPase subunit delta